MLGKKNIEAIYPLSPSQQGMLFETLSASESGIHIEQSIWNLHGDLDILAFERAWQRVVERHSILRTAFVWKDQDEPLQVVLQRVKVPLERQDWRGFSSSQQQERLEAYLKTDRLRGFKLARAPLMRLALFQTGENAYQFVWTFHHILIDGWSLPLVLKEVLAFYEAFSRDRDLSLEPSRAYRDYIGWLKQQNLSEAETFWRKKLQGFTRPTPLAMKAEPVSSSVQEDRYGKQEARLPESATAALQSLVRQQHLTLNTLIQGVWALLLSRYSGESDMVFGATVSGRPVELAGVESMIGLFINTLPVRIQVSSKASLWSWLKNIQAQDIEQRAYEYCSAGQIHQWSEVPGSLPLYESILVFENYPVDSSIKSSDLAIDIRNAGSIGAQTKYALTILVSPGSELGFQIIYDSHHFDSPSITRILEHFLALLRSIVAVPKQHIETIIGRIPATQIQEVRPFQSDSQVQIRGFRIELREISAVLAQHPAVRETMVIAQEDHPGDNRLVAYVVPDRDQLPSVGELCRFLTEKLPDHMVPSAFVLLDSLPLTPNGKVDRWALPAPDRVRPELESTFVAPCTPVEEIVTEIWAEILGLEPVGIHDNFFDLGGHSLLVTELICRIRDTFRVELPLRSIFEAPTVAELLHVIIANEAKPGQTEKIARILKQIEGMSTNDVKKMLERKRGVHA